MSSTPPLNILIVGSGLAGLTAAAILRPHHLVTVFERGTDSIATGGQGIIIAPNGTKILDSINYNLSRAGAVPILGIRTYTKEGVVLEDVDMDMKERFGADCVAMKRSDFRAELLRLATEENGSGDPVKVVFGKNVVGVDAEEGVVEFGDGERVYGDVVIVADGIHSRLRNAIVNDPSNHYEAQKTGLTCYRIAVDTESAQISLGNLVLPHWWDPQTSSNRSSIIYAGDGTPRFITAYPIHGGSMYNLACILQTQDSPKEASESWYADGDKNKMLELFGDFSEEMRRILSAATEVKVWELQDLEPLPTWTRGRSILIGDAAHAMTPLQGQGANMSIEDAEALGLLAPGTRREDVPAILRVVEDVRRERVSKVLEETRKSHGNLKVADRVFANADFNYGYNGIKETLKARDETV
ncbi:putative salicylate hydroxylase [Amniculicola lignicola CBS 123094]|uniref:Putative salicylate hydroxylase n=1 Tax=Amniculicola lignicola CBS 123094 TaxID=1392246 RepID=A0A6A5WYK6_9PLEO|nr:putative salicylate hydroxylase [Amniculicola lignicola CBS 123094]